VVAGVVQPNICAEWEMDSAMSPTEPTTHTVVQFDWEEVQEIPIQSVRGLEQRIMKDGSLSYESIAFVLGDRAVMLTVNVDFDEISVTLNNTFDAGQWTEVPSLTLMRGRMFGWCWVGTNSQGYQDAFTIALVDVVNWPTTVSALTPRLMFLAEGASLTCMEITALIS
jgi:hypothetical protein